MKKRYNSNLAFIDLLFNLILGFVFLFVVSFLLINDPTKKNEVENKAEYMIILSWDNDKDVDIDLWVEGPSGKVGFRSPQMGFLYLDKDDLGHKNDIINGGTKKEKIIYINREVINVRGFQAGEYVVNAHYYFTQAKQGENVNVSVEVLKLNPYQEVYKGTKEFKYRGQEETFVRFSMNSDGYVTDINELPKIIVMKQKW